MALPMSTRAAAGACFASLRQLNGSGYLDFWHLASLSNGYHNILPWELTGQYLLASTYMLYDSTLGLPAYTVLERVFLVKGNAGTILVQARHVSTTAIPSLEACLDKVHATLHECSRVMAALCSAVFRPVRRNIRC